MGEGKRQGMIRDVTNEKSIFRTLAYVRLKGLFRGFITPQRFEGIRKEHTSLTQAESAEKER